MPGINRRETPGETRLSATVENYLLCLYKLQEDRVVVTLSRLSEYLRQLPIEESIGTSLPSVTGVLRRMGKEDLVQTNAAKTFQLTKRGALLAEDMVRRHRLAECMLVDLLGVELHRAHAEAHRLEHAITPSLLNNIVGRLGNPQTSPYGRPIPGSGHSQPSSIVVPLSRTVSGSKYIVDRLPEENQELLRYLVAHNVVPEADVWIEEIAPFRGVITFTTSEGVASVGYESAERILLRQA